VQYLHRVWGTTKVVELIPMCLNETYSKVRIVTHLSDRFEACTAETMKNAVFWAVTLCDSCNNRRSGAPVLC
jgi:hypothetical protein